MSTLDAAAIWVTASVIGVGKTFKEPDDDWEPVLIMLNFTSAGEVDRREIGLCPLLELMDHKDVLADVIPAVISLAKPAAAALVASSWTATYAPDAGPDSKGYVPPSARPDRQEVVNIELITKNGEGRVLQAPIHRDGTGPPTLGAFTSKPMSEYVGRFVDALRLAMKQLNSSNN